MTEYRLLFPAKVTSLQDAIRLSCHLLDLLKNEPRMLPFVGRLDKSVSSPRSGRPSCPALRRIVLLSRNHSFPSLAEDSMPSGSNQAQQAAADGAESSDEHEGADPEKQPLTGRQVRTPVAFD